MGSQYFDLEMVKKNFGEAIVEEDDVNLEFYLKSFDELNKFFGLLGSIFGFVQTELNDKMNILREFLNKSDEAHHFFTVKKMVQYEKNNNLLNKKGYTSGSRTLLRINRSLEFIHKFLENLSNLAEDDGTTGACSRAYDDTLGNHHPFMIRTGAKIAMYTLPSKHKLLLDVCGTEDKIKGAEQILPETLQIMLNVYNRVHNVYKECDLLSLP